MFRCSDCKNSSKSGEKMHKVLDSIRDRTYYNLVVKNRTTMDITTKVLDKKDYTILQRLKEDNFEVIREFLTKGKEIIKEKYLCTDCYNKHLFFIGKLEQGIQEAKEGKIEKVDLKDLNNFLK